MYACICHNVTEQQVRDKAHSSCFSYAHYSKQCRLNGCCKCLPRIKELINEEKQTYSDTHYGGGID